MKKRAKDWKEKAVALAETKVLSWRRIAVALNVPKSTCSDNLRKHYNQEA